MESDESEEQQEKIAINKNYLFQYHLINKDAIGNNIDKIDGIA